MLKDDELKSILELIASVDFQNFFEFESFTRAVMSAFSGANSHYMVEIEAFLATILSLLERSDEVREELIYEVEFYLATVLVNHSRPDLGLAVLRDQLASLRVKGADSKALAMVAIRMGSACLQSRDYEQAVEHLTIAVEEAKKSGDLETMAHAENNLGLSLMELERSDEAIHLLESSVSKRMNVLGPSHLDTIATRINLNYLSFESGEHQKAVAEMYKMLGELEEAGLKTSHESVNILDLLMTWHSRLGDFSDSYSCCVEEIAIMSDLGPGMLERKSLMVDLLSQLKQIVEHPDLNNLETRKAVEYLEMCCRKTVDTSKLVQAYLND